ncbi:MAG: hypothetical protein ACQET5_08600 [Halobacteriota archaeon]
MSLLEPAPVTIDTKRLLDRLASDRGADFEFGSDPTKGDLSEAVRAFEAD